MRNSYTIKLVCSPYHWCHFCGCEKIVQSRSGKNSTFIICKIAFSSLSLTLIIKYWLANSLLLMLLLLFWSKTAFPTRHKKTLTWRHFWKGKSSICHSLTHTLIFFTNKLARFLQKRLYLKLFGSNFWSVWPE